MRSMADVAGWLGAWPLGDGRARFRLWAPDAREVALETGDGVRHAMTPETGGSFATEIACVPGTRYGYRIDGRARVPDPASRWQPDGVHGDSALLDPAAYVWRHPGWRGRPWHEAVLYELHVGLCGGYRGVRAQLPRLAAWGVTAVELMPVAEFPGRRNWGYDGVLPYAPCSAYGHPDELKALVDEAHGLGLTVLLDVVYNHFGPEGNRLHEYASGFFRADRDTPWGQAIDFRAAPVRRYFIDNALMWLRDYRFDGLRLDAVHAIRSPDFLDQLRREVDAALPDRQVHLVLENEANQASLLAAGCTAQWNDDFHHALHVLLTGESESYYADFAADPTARLARVLAEGFAFQGERDQRGRPRGEPSAALPPHAFVAFAQNHDQIGNRAHGERLTTLAPQPAVRAAQALVALSPMVPLFFMGEPWGCRAPFLFFTDYGPPLDAAVREGRRREFARFAGYADPRRSAAIPDPNAVSTFDASVAEYDERDPRQAEWSAWFGRLLRTRQRELTPWLAQARSAGVRRIGERALEARWSLGPRTLRIAVNFGAAPVALDACADAVTLHAENTAGATGALPPAGFLAQCAPTPA